jgi:hypothetical protein
MGVEEASAAIPPSRRHALPIWLNPIIAAKLMERPAESRKLTLPLEPGKLNASALSDTSIDATAAKANTGRKSVPFCLVMELPQM